jgi:uncharacterized protein (UPF0276 family)
LKNLFSKNGNALPQLGVGITYSPELDEILQSDLVDYIEIEPQTLWIKRGDNYEMPTEVIQHLNDISKKKLVHSVGIPVGGVFRGDKQHIDLLAETITTFQSPWASEHLGFNRTAEFFTGFFLPPLQTTKGVSQAVQGIQFLQDQLPVPFAVETGVNYLRPRKGEISDGEFVSQVIGQADCGLLLDLQNLYTNELNGRQSIEDFLKDIPLHRIVEIHLAGGFEMDGFWLDAHSGIMPDRLIKIAEDVVAELPCLKAITYEILPSYLPIIGLGKLEEQLQIIKDIWNKRRKSSYPQTSTKSSNLQEKIELETLNCTTWERELGLMVIGRPPLNKVLIQEPGIELIQKLVKEFRASMLVTSLRLTYRLLALSLGHDVVKVIFESFWRAFPPCQFASDEALNFAKFLRETDLALPNLSEVLLFEESTLRTLLDGQTRIVPFEYDPFPLLNALSVGKLENLQRQKGNYEIELTGEEIPLLSNITTESKYSHH